MCMCVLELVCVCDLCWSLCKCVHVWVCVCVHVCVCVLELVCVCAVCVLCVWQIDLVSQVFKLCMKPAECKLHKNLSTVGDHGVAAFRKLFRELK